MEIDSFAPVSSQGEILIASTPAIVWSLLTDFDNWSKWNPAIRKAFLEGPLAPGSVLRWKSGGTSIVSTLQEVEPMRRLSWTGKAFGMRAIHVYSLERKGECLLVRTAESLDGWLVRVLKRMFQRILVRTLEENLRALKNAAEAETAAVFSRRGSNGSPTS
jgi:hypothetical protein